jgi:hypothetical protein
MVRFRVGSLATWSGTVVLFFLPWVDFSCLDPNGRLAGRATVSGAQLAWGGVTVQAPGKPAEGTLVDLGPLLTDPPRLLAGCLLSLYLLGLLGGLALVALLPPSVPRAAIGSLLAVVLLGLLFLGSWAGLRNPLWPEPGPRLPKGLLECRYSPWYYSSYLTNLCALAWFVFEVRAARKVRQRAAILRWWDGNLECFRPPTGHPGPPPADQARAWNDGTRRTEA